MQRDRVPPCKAPGARACLARDVCPGRLPCARADSAPAVCRPLFQLLPSCSSGRNSASVTQLARISRITQNSKSGWVDTATAMRCTTPCCSPASSAAGWATAPAPGAGAAEPCFATPAACGSGATAGVAAAAPAAACSSAAAVAAAAASASSLSNPSRGVCGRLPALLPPAVPGLEGRGGAPAGPRTAAAASAAATSCVARRRVGAATCGPRRGGTGERGLAAAAGAGDGSALPKPTSLTSGRTCSRRECVQAPFLALAWLSPASGLC